jgi:hypothetical protein
MNGALITQPNSTIQLYSLFQTPGHLISGNGFTNHGLVEYLSGYYNSNSILEIASGTLTNAPDGTIQTTLGGIYTNLLRAELDNQGTVLIQKALEIDKASAAHTNSGTISLSTGNLTLTQTGTNPSFTNTGSFTVDSSMVLTVNDGSFNHNAGNFALNGTLLANNIDLNFTPAFVHTSTMTLTSSILNCAASFTNQGDLTMSNGSINGTSIFTNQANLAITLCDVNMPFDNHGFYRVTNTCNMNDTLITQPNSTIQLYSVFQTPGHLVTGNSITNHGLLEYLSGYYSNNGILEITNGTLFNASDGTIQTVAGGTNTNYLWAHVYNQGTILVGKELEINLAAAPHINTGAITVANSRRISFTGSSFTNQTSGSLNGRGTIDITNAPFSSSGEINPGNSPGILNITGNLPQVSSSVINIEIGGTVVDSLYDRLNISGAATFEGTLNISLIDNFIPVISDTFDIMTYGSQTGTFSSVNGLFTGTGVSFDLLTTPTVLRLITLDAPNHPPVISNQIADIFLDEDFGSQFVANLDSVFDDSDIPLGDSLTFNFAISNNRVSGSIIGRELFLNSVNDSNGTAMVIVTATDIGAASVSDTFIVTIVPVNDPPSVFQLLEPQNQIVLTSSDIIDFVWSNSSDADNDPLVYELWLFGASLDTSFSNIADTSFEFINSSILLPNTTYQWTASVSDGIVLVVCPDTFSFTTPVINSIEPDDPLIPSEYALNQNYPNPFNPTTSINFDLPHSSKVNIKIFNVLGEEVTTLVNRNLSPGKYQYNWNANGLASGLYFYRMETEEFVETRKMFLMK